MKKIDIHTHIMPNKMPNWVQKFGYGEFIHVEHRNCKACMMKGDKLFRVVDDNCFDATVRIHEMDATQVDVQVLSTIPVLFNYWAKPHDALCTSQFFNNHIADTVQKHPHRFIGLGTVPLQDTELAIQEMERCLSELGMKGIEIGTNVNGLNLSEARFKPFFEAAEKLGCALFIHPWDMMGEADMQQYWLPWLVGMPAETARAICSLIFGGVLQQYPKLRIAFAHGGGSFMYTLGRIQHGFKVRPDLVAIHNPIDPTAYLGKFWLDSLVHDTDMLHYLIQKNGVDKICIGSDYPFPLGEHVPGQILLSLQLSPEAYHKINYTNALDWLGMQA